jgi:hypothetical protein
VVIWLIANLLHNTFQIDEQNWVPLSEVMVSGTPNLEIHVATNASAQVAASWFLIGTASTHRDDLSMTVKM